MILTWFPAQWGRDLRGVATVPALPCSSGYPPPAGPLPYGGSGGHVPKLVKMSDYRLHAKRCRELAAEAAGLEKKYLEDMAEEWETRANNAETRPKKKPHSMAGTK